MTTTTARTPRTTAPTGTTAERSRRRLSARVRILLWLLFVMAVALASVAATTRSFLLRDVDQQRAARAGDR